MTNLLTTMLGKNSNQSSEINQIGSSVRVVGDRFSGKTTFMAALARWPNADPQTSAVQSVTANNEESKELIAEAQNILENGDKFTRTQLIQNVDEVKDYSISIVLKEKFWFKNNLLQLNINCKDYTGEFFHDLVYKTGDPVLQDYIDDCVSSNGILLLVDGFSRRLDAKYANGLANFLKELDRNISDNAPRRIAFVITKCEDSELWVNRHNPTLIASSRFKTMIKELNLWQNKEKIIVDYFATSAFGMAGSAYPEPNMKKLVRDKEGLKSSVLAYPKCWKPFGLVAPIYWLCTGKRHSQLDKEY